MIFACDSAFVGPHFFEDIEAIYLVSLRQQQDLSLEIEDKKFLISRFESKESRTKKFCEIQQQFRPP